MALASLALILAIANAILLFVVLTQSTTTNDIKDGTIALADLSPEVVDAELRGPQGPAGEPGESGRRGPKGPPGIPGAPGPPGVDYGDDVADLDSRLTELEATVSNICDAFYFELDVSVVC